jgi:hypothetical protein
MSTAMMPMPVGENIQAMVYLLFRAYPKTSWPGSHARQSGGVGAASAGLVPFHKTGLDFLARSLLRAED